MHSSIEHRAPSASRVSRRIARLLFTVSMTQLAVSCSYQNELKLPLGPYEGLGQEAAEQACRLIEDRGKVAVWIADTKLTKNQGVDQMLDSFCAALKKHGQVQLEEIERIEVNSIGLSSEDFHTLFEKSSGADAIVSFLGAPSLSAEEIKSLQTPRPKIIALDNCMKPELLNRLLQGNVIQTAIVPKAISAADMPDPSTPHEWFERNYEILKR